MEAASNGFPHGRYHRANPALTDLDVRFRVMDRYPDVVQWLTIAGPNVESVTASGDSVELAWIANDELATHVDSSESRSEGQGLGVVRRPFRPQIA